MRVHRQGKRADFVWETTPEGAKHGRPATSAVVRARVPISVAAAVILVGASASIWAIEDVSGGGTTAAPVAASVPRSAPTPVAASTEATLPQLPAAAASSTPASPAASTSKSAQGAAPIVSSQAPVVRRTTASAAPAEAARTTSAAKAPATTPVTSAAAAVPTQATTTTAAPSACSTPWATSTAYVRGNEVAYDGRLWSANQWNYNEVPGGAAGAWDDIGTC